MTNDLITDFMEIIKKECRHVVATIPEDLDLPVDVDEILKACAFMRKLLPMVKVVIDHNERLEAMNKKLSDLLTIEIEKGEVSK